MFICEIWLFDCYFPQYVEVRISRNVSQDPFDFQITRVDCILTVNVESSLFHCFVSHLHTNAYVSDLTS